MPVSPGRRMADRDRASLGRGRTWRAARRDGAACPRGGFAPAAPMTIGDDRATISVVIPALNEAANLPHVLTRLPASVDEVVLVDGNSSDDTVAVAIAVRPDVRVIHQDRRGKGNALSAGFAAATGDIIV